MARVIAVFERALFGPTTNGYAKDLIWEIERRVNELTQERDAKQKEKLHGHS